MNMKEENPFLGILVSLIISLIIWMLLGILLFWPR